MRKQIFICVLIACNVFSYLCAEIEVKLSKSSVALNESFAVDFSSKLQTPSQPDFSPLQENFEVLSCGQSTSIKIINNTTSREHLWHLVLQSRTEGALTIPSITRGTEHSLPKTIQVTATREIPQDGSLILETEVSPKDAVYEQGQLIYTIKLYRSVNLAQASLSELKINDPDAIVERLGKDTEYEHMHANGARYIVLERNYAIFPQHDGELIFSPMVFDGQVVKGGSSFFNVQTEHKRIISNALKVIVKPIPAPFQKSDWFPANTLKLNEEWSADPSTMTVGEPITRTITITADGCLGNQIPAIAFNFPKNLKHYLDKPEATNKTNANGFVGVKQMKVALIPSKAGEIELPEVTFKWWDLKTDQERTASLPSRTIQVQDTAIAMNSTPLPALDQNSIPQDFQNLAVDFSSDAHLPVWAWCLIALNLIWIFILLKAIFQKGQKFFSPKVNKPESARDIKKELKWACQHNDAKQAEVQLLTWAATLYPQVTPLNLMGIKPHLSSALQSAIDELNEALYGQKKTWEGDSLWHAVSSFKPVRKLNQAKSQIAHLRELY